VMTVVSVVVFAAVVFSTFCVSDIYTP